MIELIVFSSCILNASSPIRLSVWIIISRLGVAKAIGYSNSPNSLGLEETVG
jgi:hypothetical protein